MYENNSLKIRLLKECGIKDILASISVCTNKVFDIK